MARLNPDDLRDEPVNEHYARTNDFQPWEKAAQKIRGMLVGSEYEYARNTLEGMLDTITSRQIVTERQSDAIQRIQDKPSRGSDRRRTGGW